MASESGTAAVVGFLNTSVIQKMVHWYLIDNNPAQMFSYIQPIAGQGTDTAAFDRVTKQTALSGTITELNGLSNTVFQTSKVTAAISEIGVLRQFTKKVEKTNILGADGLHMTAIQDAIKMCLEKFETDIWSQFANASTTVGTTGLSFTVANFAAAIAQMTINKAVGPMVAMLTSTQVKNLRADIASNGAGVFAAGLGNDVMKPVGQNGYVGVFFGVPTYTNNLASASGGDKIGALMVDGNAYPEGAPYGVSLGWMPEASMLNQPQFSGGLQVAVTMAYGAVEILDGAYVGTVTVA